MSGDPRRHTDVLMMFALGVAVDLDRVCLAVAELVRRDAAHARLVGAAEALWARYSADTATMEEPLQAAWSELSGALCEGARAEDTEEVDELEELLARTSELRARIRERA